MTTHPPQRDPAVLDDQHRRSLLDREPSVEDRDAVHEPPRPGVWAGEDAADLRKLTQDQTDLLIRTELLRVGGLSPLAAFPVQAVEFVVGRDRVTANVQRGGIDSDSLVRVLARRAWGDRDGGWFALRGVRKGDPLIVVSGRCALARPQERPQATALGEARPGELVLCDAAGCDARVGEAWCRVTDRLRDEPSVVYQDADDPLAHPARLGIRRILRETVRAEFYDHVRTRYAGPDEGPRLIALRRVEYGHAIEAALARGGDPRELARELALRSPLTHDDAVELVDSFVRCPREVQLDTQGIPTAIDPAVDDSGVLARWLLAYRVVIAAGLARGAPPAELARDLALTSPLTRDEAARVVAEVGNGQPARVVREPARAYRLLQEPE